MLAATPAAVAIFVFGVIYGSVAEPVLGEGSTILSSLLIYSGAVQFTVLALAGSGAAVGAVFAGAATLNLRNLLLGAVMRPHLDQGPLTRASMAWFLTDEGTGLALTSKRDPSRTLLIAGVYFYVSWQLGTILGLAGASVDALRGAAEALFPVLFIGLTAAACTSRSVALRAVGAAALTAGVATLWPETRGVVAVIAAVIVALPGTKT